MTLSNCYQYYQSYSNKRYVHVAMNRLMYIVHYLLNSTKIASTASAVLIKIRKQYKFICIRWFVKL